MRLTKKKAIEYSIELWEYLAETGKLKEGWPEWEKYGDAQDYCFLCEWAHVNGSCENCPLTTSLGKRCDETSYDDWCGAKTQVTRKKYAKLFLEQLRALK